MTAWCNIITLLSFGVSYIVFIKTLIPKIIVDIFGENQIPEILSEGKWSGQIFWATVYTITVFIPLSLPRKVGTLGYASLLGFISTIYLVIVLIMLFFVDRSLVPNIGKNIVEAAYFKTSYNGMVSAIPFVVFAFMYQPNIPIVYRELKVQTYASMSKVVLFASLIVVSVYIAAATFGYLGLVNQPELQEKLLDKSNILEVDYESPAFTIAVIVLIITVSSAAPQVILPAKDDFEDIFFKKDGMNLKWNILTTITMCVVCYLLAVVVPSISDIISILGSTTNPVSGFLLPIVFYLKL